MKMKKLRVTFEKSMSVVLFAPSDMADADIQDLAWSLAADGLRGWDEPEWEARVTPSKDVTIPDEDLQPGQRVLAPFSGYDVVLVNDARDDMVGPDDATWWIPKSEEESK